MAELTAGCRPADTHRGVVGRAVLALGSRGVRRHTAGNGEPDDPPIACTLSAGQMAERQTLIQALVADAMLDRRPIPSGVRLTTARRRRPVLEYRGPGFVAAFAAGCGLSSVYGFLPGTWPFGVVEAI
jgi:hypothetical protein